MKKNITEGWKEGFNLTEVRSYLPSSQVGERAPGEIKQHSHVYTRETNLYFRTEKVTLSCLCKETELEGLRYEKLILPVPKPAYNFVQNFVLSQLSCHPCFFENLVVLEPSFKSSRLLCLCCCTENAPATCRISSFLLPRAFSLLQPRVYPISLTLITPVSRKLIDYMIISLIWLLDNPSIQYNLRVKGISVLFFSTRYAMNFETLLKSRHKITSYKPV